MNKHKSDKSEVAGRLRTARLRAHVSIDDAAKAAKVQPLALEKWERGASLPSLLEFRELLPLYGVMACEVLFEDSPIEFTQEQAAELRRAAVQFSPGLRSRVDFFLAVLSRATEPKWKAGAMGDAPRSSP